VLRQASGGNSTRITLVAIFSFFFLALVGVIVVVAFRRQAALLTESETASGASVPGGIPCLSEQDEFSDQLAWPESQRSASDVRE
jgi:hypothetical protein